MSTMIPEQELRLSLIPLITPDSGVRASVANGVSTTLILSVGGAGMIESDMQIMVEDEIMYVSAVASNGSQATVIRGQDTTSGVTHFGAAIKIINLYFERMPPDTEVNSEQVVLNIVSGGTDNGRNQDAQMMDTSFEFRCFAATEVEARTVWRNVRDQILTLENTITGNIYYNKVIIQGPGVPLIDGEGSDQGWPLTLGIVTVMMRSLS